MTLRASLLSISAALLATSVAHAAPPPDFNAYAQPRPAPLASARARASAASSLGVVASVDEQTGRPAFFWASPTKLAPPGSLVTPERAARYYLGRLASAYGLSKETVDALEVRRILDTGRGAIVVALGQTVSGLPVFRRETKLLLDRDLKLIAVSGSPSAAPVVRNKLGGATSTMGAAAVVARAYTDLFGEALSPSSIRDARKVKGGFSYLDLTPDAMQKTGRVFTSPARVKRVLFALPDALVPATMVEIAAAKADGSSPSAYHYVIADDGSILYRQSRTQFEAYQYRVWADPDGRPLDGPISDVTPHPTGFPDGTVPSFIAPSLVTVDGLNTNPQSKPDPWLPLGATETNGNNVDACADHKKPEGYGSGDLRATTTGPNIFDRVYDTGLDPLATNEQAMAAVTQIFFTTNWLHDFWYDSGFNEAAGNAQKDNYGRGGQDGDPLLALGQFLVDGGTNNAYMTTLDDGISPGMHMYLWDGVDDRSLTVNPGAISYDSSSASFGPEAFNLTADLIIVDDGAAPTTDACQPIKNDLTGKIALIDRGSCNFADKAKNAEMKGAVGVLIANNIPGDPPFALGGGNPPTVNIPSMGITFEAGQALQTAVKGGPVSATMTRVPGVKRDGTIDNTVVAHEWGHYLHHRSTLACNSQACGAESEGWGDFIAIHTLVREGDNLDGVFGQNIYAGVSVSIDPAYFGDRRVPYSVDFTKNALTFRHIADGEALPAIPLGFGDPGFNSEVHSAGEVWATMVFEAYVALLKRSQGPGATRTFTQMQRAMADYVVAGMQLAPDEPTFTEQRDAMIAAAEAANPSDATDIAAAFARRGAGVCAVSPPRDSTDFVGVVESFESGGAARVVRVSLKEGDPTCDKDGTLDAFESGTLEVEVQNIGRSPLDSAEVSVATAAQGLSFPGMTTIKLPSIAASASAVATFDVALDGSVTDIVDEIIDVTLNAPIACEPKVTEVIRMNYDELKEASATDSVETEATAWTTGGKDASSIWARERTTAPGVAPTNTAWHGQDHGAISDTRIESPALLVSPTDPFVMTFEHRHQFETGPDGPNGPDVYWDGGVIEISVDGGTFEDVSKYVAPGYGGAIGNLASNPLADRQGFVSENASWPGTDAVSLDFGMALAGKSVRVRFRIGTDEAVGLYGWDIDTIGFQGITNTPFDAQVPDASCEAPVADAGPDQIAVGLAPVSLDGSASADPDGDALTFSWKQTEGPDVKLSDATSAKPSFDAPASDLGTVVTFELTVSDGKLDATDSVSVRVLSSVGSEKYAVTGSGGDCGVARGGSGAGGGGLGALGVLLALLFRRRSKAS